MVIATRRRDGRRIGWLAVALTIAVVAMAGPTAAYTFQGIMRGNSDWLFLAKFCFDNDGPGNVTYEIDTSSPTMQLVLYDDDADQWGEVYGSSLTCQQKLTYGKVFEITPNKTGHIRVDDDVRPHYWYVVAADCNPESKPLFGTYSITFINSGGSELSYDEEGLPAFFVVMFIIYLAAVAVHLFSILQYRRFRGSYVSFHTILLLFSAAIFCEFGSIIMLMIYYSHLGNTGSSAGGWNSLGELLDMASQLIYLFILVLIAKGWTITTTTLTHQFQIKIGFAVYTVAYLALFLWEHLGVSPASTIFEYDSAPGILIALLHVGLLFVFLWLIRGTYKFEHEKAQPDGEKIKFLLGFGALGTAYLVALPFVIIFAAVLAAWVRLKVVTIMMVLVQTIALGGMGLLLYPSRVASWLKLSLPDPLYSSYTPYDEVL